MICELSRTDFIKCGKLLNRNGQLEAKAVVHGVNSGRIFVDNPISPKSALIWLGNNDGFIFIGDEENETFNNGINSLIEDLIEPEAKKIGLKWFEGLANHPKWNKTIEELFKHHNLGTWVQRVYILQEHNFKIDCDPVLEEGYTVREICKSLLENNNITNIEFLHSKIKEFWSNPEDFFHRGIGFCVVFENQIVSVCLSGFVFEKYHCIDIETMAAHRGKKLAQKIAYIFVKVCLEQKWIPYWDCMDSNKPSIAVAEKIGFTQLTNYVGYEFPFE